MDTDEPADVKMVFHNYKSIMTAYPSGDQYAFRNVPKDEPVTIIALKGRANHLQMAVKNMLISNGPITGLSFKPVTMADIKATMQQFNTLFESTAMK